MRPALEVVTEGITREHQRRAGARTEASPEDHAKAFAQAALDALKAAGYSVVPTGETEHLVRFTEEAFVVQHPLACRPNLLACHYNDAYFDGPLGDEPGTYRFRFNGDGEPELLERVA